MNLGKILLYSGGVVMAIAVIGAIAGSDGDEDAVVSTTTTTTEAITTTTTTEAPPTTTTTSELTEEDLTIDPEVLFSLTMQITMDDNPELLEGICPVYSTLDRPGREAMVATSFTPTQDLSAYDGWDAARMTTEATDWFDTSCGLS